MNTFVFGFDFIFRIFLIIFLLVFGTIFFTYIRGINTYFKSNKQPIIPVQAKVVTKRYNLYHHHNTGEVNNSFGSTSYYITFEFSNKERIELKVPTNEYGMLVEGDMGTLTFQGTRYISFIRE